MPANNYQRLIFPGLARMDAEQAHRLALRALHTAERIPGGLMALQRGVPDIDARLRVTRFSLSFSNPLGVAAGLDKDAEAITALFSLGFAAVETGTVTPRPQPGNPKPRIWRVPDEHAVINAMGFPSGGAASVRARIIGNSYPGVLGINLGKNKETPLDEAANDYVRVLDDLWPFADYLTINVSSPNTPGLRTLQGRDALSEIVRAVQKENMRKAEIFGKAPRPVLVKIAPDLDDAQLDDVLAGTIDGNADGLIISNTTIDRGVLRNRHESLPGGVSGQPLKTRAQEILQSAYTKMGDDRLPIIGVGGITNAEDVIERMKGGASLVQIYTGFIYGGPGLPSEILRGLTRYVDREGLRSIEEIIGASHT